jgi:hypothetical protein
MVEMTRDGVTLKMRTIETKHTRLNKSLQIILSNIYLPIYEAKASLLSLFSLYLGLVSGSGYYVSELLHAQLPSQNFWSE